MNSSEQLSQMEMIADMLIDRGFMDSGLLARLFRVKELVFLGCLAILLIGCEVRDINPETGEVIFKEQQKKFDAAEYVDEIWQDKVIPRVREKAVELSSLLEAIKNGDPELADQYGFSEGNQSSALLVKGTGTVVEVDTTSRIGILRVDIPTAGKGPNVRLQIGPVISGTALRDAMPFITFDQFTNQLEYAAVSRAMHNHLMETELGAMNFSEFEGKTISFNGAFRYENNEVTITPVNIEVTEE